MTLRILFRFIVLSWSPCLLAENAFVRESIPLPAGEVMEIGSIALMPEKRIAVATRRGDLWFCDGAHGEDLSKVRWTLAAQGLHEPFGMSWRDGALIVTQRPEVTVLRDLDGDDSIDDFQTLAAPWGITGDYHEYAFGSPPDKEGNIWVVLCLTGSWDAHALYRGWCLRITPDGRVLPTCSGIRSPGGIGFNAAGDAFYTDNQGTWNGSSALKWLRPGSFQGNPEGNKYHKEAGFPPPPNPKSGSRIRIEQERFPELVPPAVIFPHGKVGQSPTAVILESSAGKFGPFAGQMLVGEQTHAEVQRVFLEKVDGLYQGAVFKFLGGFRSGVVPMRLSEDGFLFVGTTNRGWAARGDLPFSFERVRWTGELPFEVHEMRAKCDGFELTFTKAVDPKTAGDPKSYTLQAWTYIYQSGYGSPEVEHAIPVIEGVKVASDGRSARLKISGLVEGHVHHLAFPGVRSEEGEALAHPEAYYTLNKIPKQ